MRGFLRSRSLSVLLGGALVLLGGALVPRPAVSEEGADETLDVKIRLAASWDDVGRLGDVNILESGKASFVIRGRMKLDERDGDTLAYVPESLHATWRWQQVYRVSPKVKARDACPPDSILSVETGTGALALGPDDVTLQVIVGEAAGMAASVYGGSSDADGVYVLMAKKLVDTTIEQRQQDCFPAPYPEETSGKRFFLLHAQGVMKHGRIRGTQRWTQQERVSIGALEAQILEFGGTPLLSGRVPGGNVHVEASWRLGKPKLLQIQRREGDAWQDVTHEEGDAPWDVLVGERVDLRAVLLPEEELAADGAWTVPGSVVEDWVVEGEPEGFGRATVDPLEAPERQGGTVGFHWWRESGERTVSVRTSQGGTKQAQARFRVEEPETVVRTVVPSRAEFKVVMKPNGTEELVCLVEGEHTITFRHEPLPWTTPGETQYVQLVDTTGRTEMGTSSTVGPCMELRVNGLDTTYPYAPGPRATDNPGVPAATYDLKLSVRHELEMFLLYRPDTPGAIWVPLRVVPWTWHGQAQRETEGAAWDCSASTITRNPSDVDAPCFPEWKRVSTEHLPWSPCSD